MSPARALFTASASKRLRLAAELLTATLALTVHLTHPASDGAAAAIGCSTFGTDGGAERIHDTTKDEGVQHPSPENDNPTPKQASALLVWMRLAECLFLQLSYTPLLMVFVKFSLIFN